MKQAKTLTDRELKKVLDYVAVHRYAARNRAMLLITYLAGLRVSEVAMLKCSDVIALDGTIKTEIQLSPQQTKGGHARTVFVNDRLKKELTAYVKTLKRKQPELALFSTQKREAFSRNTLCQHFYWLYRHAGIDGASSHSGRRTFITTLASKGVSVRVLASLAGHKSIATTQAYIDVNDDMKRATVQLI